MATVKCTHEHGRLIVDIREPVSMRFALDVVDLRDVAQTIRDHYTFRGEAPEKAEQLIAQVRRAIIEELGLQ